jgi:hypothetical protein
LEEEDEEDSAEIEFLEHKEDEDIPPAWSEIRRIFYEDGKAWKPEFQRTEMQKLIQDSESLDSSSESILRRGVGEWIGGGG